MTYTISDAQILGFHGLTNEVAKNGILDRLEAFLSEASDRVSPSDFATQDQYEKALKSELAKMLAAEKNTDKPRFTFDVVTGKLARSFHLR